MNRFSLRLALLVLAFACAPGLSRAQTNLSQPPGLISYQGFLTDANGIPLATNTPQNFNIVFNIYSAATGGTPLWGESQVVTVNQGYFTVLLGVGNAIPSSTTFHTNDLTYLFNTNNAQSRYIGITVAGLGTGEIVPRLRLLSAPYALLASTALSVSGQNIIDATNLAPDIGLWSVNGANIFRTNGNVGIGTATPLDTLDVNGTIRARDQVAADGFAGIQPGNSAQAGYFEWYKPGGSRMGYMGWEPDNINLNLNSANFYISGGNLGIGTASPVFPLTFASVLGDKLALWWSGANNSSYGFGVQSGLLQIHTDVSGSDVAFGSGSSGAFTETMRVKGNGNVGIGTTAPGALLHVTGPVRMGNETGTSEGPARAGLVIRRTQSTSQAVGQIVARGAGGMTLERDGSNGGLRIHLGSAYVGPLLVTGNWVDWNGNSVNVHFIISGGSTGYYTVCVEGNYVARLSLSFGDAYYNGDMTDVLLNRTAVNNSYDDYYWVGTVTSTVNQ